MHGRAVIYFAVEATLLALSRHRPIVAAFKDELATRSTTRGTIRFPLSRPSREVDRRIAKFRAKEVAEREKTKSAAPKKQPTAAEGQPAAMI